MRKIILSVIVAVYNEEKNIRICLQSILNSTLQEIEVIVIDDGSIDRTYFICMEMAKYDSRLKVVKKENGGVSSARNIGLQIAKGRYFVFVDGDDYVDRGLYETMLKTMQQYNADLCCCKIVQETMDHKKIKINTEYKNSIVEGKKCIFKRFFGEKNSMGFAACNKMAKREIQERQGVLFNEKYHECEDGAFWCDYLMYVEKVVFTNIGCYHHVRNGDNVSSNPELTRRKLTNLDAWEHIICQCEKISNNLGSLARAYCQSYIVHLYVEAMIYYGGKDIPDKKISNLNKYQKDFYCSPYISIGSKIYNFFAVMMVKIGVDVKWILRWRNIKQIIKKNRPIMKG